jgi:hypothetical protein
LEFKPIGEIMGNEKLFQRVLKNRCPVSDRPIEGEQTEIVEYGKAKLVVIKEYIKFKR